MQTEIYEFLHERHGGQKVPVGVIMATRVGQKVRITWSKAKTRGPDGTDEYNQGKGLGIARSRVKGGSPRDATIPHLVRRRLAKFTDRAARYFKVEGDIALV
jgi:hypothetical protein